MKQRQEHLREIQLIRSEHADEISRIHHEHQLELQLFSKRANAMHHLHDHEKHMLENVCAQNGLTKKGIDGYLELVAERLQLLESRQLHKEAEARQQIEDIKRVAQFEVELERQKAELALRQKTHEIEQFKLEMDALLSDMGALRA
jgi:putative protein kinase ArgK-like GTPase of G3E family